MLASIMRDWLSVTSSCEHTMDRILESWLPSGFPQHLAGSEAVGNTALLPARSPKCPALWRGVGGWWTPHRRIHEHEITAHTKLCVWPFQAGDSTPTWQYLGDVLQVRPPPQTGWGDAQGSWPLQTCSGLQGHREPLGWPNV